MLPFLVVLTFVLLEFRIPMKNVDLCLLPLLGMVVPLQLMALDEQSKWTFATRLYPYTPLAAVLSRYIWGWMFTTLGVALSVGTAYWSYTTRQLAIPADTFPFLCWLVGQCSSPWPWKFLSFSGRVWSTGKPFPWPCWCSSGL